MGSAVADYPRDANYWATIALFTPLYVQRFFIGGVGGEYSDYAGISTWWIGYVVHLGFIASLAFLKRKRGNTGFVLIAFTLIIYSILQIYYISSIEQFREISILLPLMRSFIWLIAIFVYCQNYFETNSFIKGFIDITTVSAIIIVLCYVSYLITNVPFGIDIGRGVARPQGLFSEPSALASVFPSYTILNYLKKNYKQSLFGLIVIALVASATVYIVFIIMIFILLIIYRHIFTKLFLYFYVSLAVISTLFIQSDFIGWANDQAQLIDSRLNQQFGPSVIREVTIDRLISAANGLNNFISQNSISDLSNSGSGARLAGSIVLMHNMTLDGTYWTGYGIGVYGYLTNIIYQSIFDFGLLPFFISSFGVVIGPMIIFLLARNIIRILYYNKMVYVVFAGGLIGTLYNSAGGIHAYTIALLALIIPLSEFENVHGKKTTV